MAYVAVKGGREAIENSINYLNILRNDGTVDPISISQIRRELHFLVDKVMSEASLYSPDLAALSIKQSSGDIYEASFMLRAFRSTLPRLGYTNVILTKEIRLIRRISSAFKDIPGGQYLGPSTDYSLRLLDFELLNETKKSLKEKFADFLKEIKNKEFELPETFPKLIELLRNENLIVSESNVKKDEEIFDITKQSIIFPTPRSGVLQALSRGETGGLLLLAYSNVRGYGMVHPTVGELRVGYVTITVKHPFKDKDIVIGEILITETEVISKIIENEDNPKFQLGYGICFGHNELKSLSMAILDISMREGKSMNPSEDQEFVLSHIDCIESMGFISHFKLPHYVTFLSDLDRLRNMVRKKDGVEDEN